MNELMENELTARQSGAEIVRDARQRLAELHERERRELEATATEFQGELAAMADVVEGELAEQMRTAIAGAMRGFREVGAELRTRAEIARIVSPEELASIRAETWSGELPMTVIARRPTLQEKGLRGPVLAVIDLTDALNVPER